MCIYTKMYENKKYKPNKKNGGNPPKIKDERTKYVPIKCGNCIECRKSYAEEWKIRLMHEIEKEEAQFVTLTFSNKSIIKLTKKWYEGGNEKVPTGNDIATIAIQGFKDRWRHKHGKALKRWLITEMGHKGTERIHLHGIIFTGEDNKEIQRRWKYGRTHLGYSMNNKVIGYVVKYVTKIDKDHPGFKGKIMCSPGIGKKFINKGGLKYNQFKGKDTITHLRTENGGKTRMPVYYRNNAYSEEEREKLWIQKLDSNEMFVMGQRIRKINTLEGKKELEKALEWARTISVKRGYGNGNNKKKEYAALKNNEKIWNTEKL